MLTRTVPKYSKAVTYLAKEKKFYTIFVSSFIFKKLQLLARMEKNRDVNSVVAKLVMEKLESLAGDSDV